MAKLVMPTISERVSAGGNFGNDRGPKHYPRYHEGVDLSVGVGTDIYGSGDGVVDYVGNTGRVAGYGLYVRVRYGNVSVINSHMSSVLVGVGQAIGARTLLGKSGGTKGSFGAGDATGPHDHLEVRSSGVLVNPLDLLASRSEMSGSTGTQLGGFLDMLSDKEQRDLYDAIMGKDPRYTNIDVVISNVQPVYNALLKPVTETTGVYKPIDVIVSAVRQTLDILKKGK